MDMVAEMDETLFQIQKDKFDHLNNLGQCKNLWLGKSCFSSDLEQLKGNFFQSSGNKTERRDFPVWLEKEQICFTPWDCKENLREQTWSPPGISELPEAK